MQPDNSRRPTACRGNDETFVSEKGTVAGGGGRFPVGVRGLRPCDRRRVCLGRRRPCDQGCAAGSAGTLAHLVGARGDAAVLSRSAQRILARTPALGRFAPGIPCAERAPSRIGGLPVRAGPAAAVGLAGEAAGNAGSRARRRMAGGLPVCPASGQCRVGGVGVRAEEHAVRCLLPGSGDGVPGFFQPAEAGFQVEPLCAGLGAVRPGPPDQERHGDASGRPVRRHLVESRAAAPPRPALPAAVGGRRVRARGCSRRGWSATLSARRVRSLP